MASLFYFANFCKNKENKDGGHRCPLWPRRISSGHRCLLLCDRCGLPVTPIKRTDREIDKNKIRKLN